MVTVYGRAYPLYEIDKPRNDRPLLVSSVGHTIPVEKTYAETLRPSGRRDYQIIYIRSGRAHFYLDGQERVLSSGHIFLYRPMEPQHYRYYAADQPNIYWVHFTGSRAAEELEALGLSQGPEFDVSCHDEYAALFDEIIQELQMKRPRYGEVANAVLMKLLCLFSRELSTREGPMVLRTPIIEETVRMFHTQFNRPFHLAEYAAAHNMSSCWLSRLFRREMGVSPQRYLTDIRIGRACELLASGCGIAEACETVGYQDACYFSHVFKKYTGYSPTAYIKTLSW